MSDTAPKHSHRRRWLLTIALVVATAWLLATTVASPERWRSQFAAIAGAAIGKPVQLNGPLHWTLGHGPGLRAEQVVLANPDWTDTPAFAEARAVEMELSWAALLRGRVAVSRVDIDRLRVDLRRQTDGSGNWGFAPRPSKAGTGANKVIPDIAVTGLDLSYRDADSATTHQYHFPELQLHGGAGQPLRLSSRLGEGQLALELRGPTLGALIAKPREWPLQVILSDEQRRLDAVVTVDLSADRPQVNGSVTLELGQEQALANTSPFPLTTDLAPTFAKLRGFDADLRLDLKSPHWRSQLTLTLNDGLAQLRTVDGSAQLSLNAASSPPTLSAERHSAPLDLKAISTTLGWPDSPLLSADKAKLQAHSSGSSVTELLTKLRGHAEFQQLQLDPVFDLKVAELRIAQDHNGLGIKANGDWSGVPFTLTQPGRTSLVKLLRPGGDIPLEHRIDLGSNQINLSGHWHRDPGRPRLSGKLTLTGKDPSSLNPLLNQTFPKGLAYRIRLQLDTDGTNTSLSNIHAQLGPTEIRGTLQLDQQQPVTRITGKLQIPRLSLPVTDPSSKAPKSPLSLPGNISTDIELGIGQFNDLVLDAGKLRTRAQLDQAELRLDPLRFNLAGIKASGSAVVRNQGDGLSAQSSLAIAPVTRQFQLGRGSRRTQLQLQTPKGHLELASHGHGDQWLNNLRIDGRFDGLALKSERHSGTVLHRLRLTKRAGKPLTVNAAGTFDGRPLTLRQHLFPATARRTARFDLALSAADLQIALDGQMTRSNALAEIDFSLSAKQAGSLPLFLQHSLGRRGPYLLDGKLHKTPLGYRIEPFRLLAGSDDLGGHFEFNDKPPKLTAVLRSRHLKADFQAPAAIAGSAPQQVIPALNLIPQIPVGWDADYHLDVAKLLLGHNTLNQFQLKGKLRNSRLTIDTLRARLPNHGKLSARLDARLIDNRLDAHLSGQADGLDLGWMLTKPGSPTIPWLTTIELDLKGRGRDLREYLAGANGAIRFIGGPMEMDTSALDLWTLDLLHIAVPNLLTANQNKDSGLLCSVAGFRIDKGLMNSEGMLFNTSKAVILGSGSINLRDETLNLLLSAKKKRFSLLSITTPVTLSGTLKHPKAGIAPEQLAATAGGVALRVVQPWVLAADMLNSGYHVDNPCLKTFEDMTKQQADRQDSGGSPFGQALRGIGSDAGEAVRGIGSGLDRLID